MLIFVFIKFWLIYMIYVWVKNQNRSIAKWILPSIVYYIILSISNISFSWVWLLWWIILNFFVPLITIIFLAYLPFIPKEFKKITYTLSRNSDTNLPTVKINNLYKKQHENDFIEKLLNKLTEQNLVDMMNNLEKFKVWEIKNYKYQIWEYSYIIGNIWENEFKFISILADSEEIYIKLDDFYTFLYDFTQEFKK